MSRRLMDIPHRICSKSKNTAFVQVKNLQTSTEDLCLSPLTHPGGFIQQELEGVVCCLGGF